MDLSDILQAPLTALLGFSGIILFVGPFLKIKTKRWFEVPDENGWKIQLCGIAMVIAAILLHVLVPNTNSQSIIFPVEAKLFQTSGQK